MARRAIHLYLLILQTLDRWRLRRLARRHPGLELHPQASTNFAWARFLLAEGAVLRIGAGAVCERRAEGVRFDLGPGAQVTIGEGCWLRSDLGPVQLVAFAGARIDLGRDCFLNGAHLSAKEHVELGERVFVGPGCRIFDSDQHDFDANRPECTEPVRIGAHTWVASDATVLRGVEIGAHCVIGARSLVTRSIPDHSLAFGLPAEVRGRVDDRSKIR